MAFNPGKFLREVRTESAKIVWPTRRETLMTGLMVVIMTSLLAIESGRLDETVTISKRADSIGEATIFL